MYEFWQCVPTFDSAQTFASSSLSIADSFIIGLKANCLSYKPIPNCALRNSAGFAVQVMFVYSSQTQTRNAAGTEIGTRYRYIDDTPLVPMTEAGKANGTNATSSASSAKTRSRPNNEYVLYSYGEPVAMSGDGNASYFGTDILGSVRNVTDKYGTVQADYSYDAFCSPYLGNLENDIGFGYCGKSYDVGTGLYDYGFRDYSPNNARFTTVDPIRDGSNWFSYVVNDPVNWCDPFGLSATDSRTVHSGDTLGNMTWLYNKQNGTHYTAAEIAEFNGIANPDIIYPGQTINFPGRSTTTTTTATTATQVQTTPNVKTSVSTQSVGSAQNLGSAVHGMAAGVVQTLNTVGSAPPAPRLVELSPSSKGINLSGMTTSSQKKFLEELNRYSYYQISLKNGNLLINPSGSKTFGTDLILAITGDVQIKIILAANVIKGKEEKTIEGGFCTYNAEKKEALIAINPNTAFYQAEDGSINIASAVGVFIHELSGHLLPEIYNINGNAIERENVIRKELSLPLRKEDLSHVCF